jgi:carbon storage regulator
MLVLCRKLGERIVIADCVVVKVLTVKGDRVRLGIAAPPHVRVTRQELQARAVRPASPRVLAGVEP